MYIYQIKFKKWRMHKLTTFGFDCLFQNRYSMNCTSRPGAASEMSTQWTLNA